MRERTGLETVAREAADVRDRHAARGDLRDDFSDDR